MAKRTFCMLVLVLGGCTSEVTTEGEHGDDGLAGAAGQSATASMGGASAASVAASGGAVTASGGSVVMGTIAAGEIAVRECLLVMRNGCAKCAGCSAASVLVDCVLGCERLLQCWAIKRCVLAECPQSACDSSGGPNYNAAAETFRCSCAVTSP